MTKLLLASGSSRRQELLEQIGVKYHSASMDIDESVLLDESPNDYVNRLAREKAIAGVETEPASVVLAADTTVVAEGDILGKPENEQAAYDMLKQLSGATHQVLTGIAVAQRVDEGIMLESDVVVTDVAFLSLSDKQIEHYVRTGEPMDKAGAYGIQGKAALFVDGIKGSYSNVVGLPLAETGAMLQRFGISVWDSE